jgi:putative FmdB family regulatory protein
MPIYEYQCQGCEHEFETIQKMSEAPLIQCPSCGKDLLRKKISAVAFRLKGGGWYETDFKSGDKKNVATSSDSGSDSSSTAATSSKSESNSETKSSGSGEAKSSAAASDGGGDKKGSGSAAPKAKSETKPSTD